jgi:hypothetical protein
MKDKAIWILIVLLGVLVYLQYNQNTVQKTEITRQQQERRDETDKKYNKLMHDLQREMIR